MAYMNSKSSDQPELPCSLLLLFYVHYSRLSNKIFVAYSMYLMFLFRPNIYMTITDYKIRAKHNCLQLLIVEQLNVT